MANSSTLGAETVGIDHNSEDGSTDEDDSSSGDREDGLAGQDSLDAETVPRLAQDASSAVNGGSLGADTRTHVDIVGVPAGGAEVGEDGGGNGVSSTGGVRRPRTCVHFLKGRCRYGDACRYSHDAEPYAMRKKQKTSRMEPKVNARPTLLKALLAKEVRAERSLLLQCVRRLVSLMDNDEHGVEFQ